MISRFKNLLKIFILSALVMTSAACAASNETKGDFDNSNIQSSSGTFQDNDFLAAAIKKSLQQDCTNIPQNLSGEVPQFIDYWYLNEDWKVFQFGEAYFLISPQGDFGPDIEDGEQLSLHESWGCEGTDHFISGLLVEAVKPDVSNDPEISLSSPSGECYRFNMFRGCKVNFIIENITSGPINIFGSIYAVVDGEIYYSETSRIGEVLYIESSLNPNQYYEDIAYFALSEGQVIERIFFGPVPELNLADAILELGIQVDYDLYWDN